MLPESTTEKTALLIRAMAWQWDYGTVWKDFKVFWESPLYTQWGEPIPEDEATFNFYDEENMALALRVFRWARRNLPPALRQRLKDWLRYNIVHDLIFFSDAQNDQEYILDTVLGLLIEAGMVETADVTGR